MSKPPDHAPQRGSPKRPAAERKRGIIPARTKDQPACRLSPDTVGSGAYRGAKLRDTRVFVGPTPTRIVGFP